MKVTVLSAPSKKQVGLTKLVRVLNSATDDVSLITGNFVEDLPEGVKLVNIPTLLVKEDESYIRKAIRLLLIQFTASAALARVPSGPVIIFRPIVFLLPTLIVKLLRRKIFVIMTGYSEEVWKVKGDRFRQLMKFTKWVNLNLADKIVIYHKDLISGWDLDRYRDKIEATNYLYADLKKFKPTRFLADREYDVGYIGRISEEKGILNLIDALALLPNIKRLVIGGYPKGNSLKGLTITGWLPHSEIPFHLNSIKVLILPSYSEGLPNIVLEAFACGTPVLLPEVGALKSILGSTGIFMPDNRPETIVDYITDSLNQDYLEQKSKEARQFVERNFTFEKIVKDWRALI